MFNQIQKQITTDFFQQNFSNDGQRFVAWYLRNVLFRDMNETRDDITDGANDKQIDALIVDDGQWLVIGGKLYVIDATSHCKAMHNRHKTVKVTFRSPRSTPPK